MSDIEPVNEPAKNQTVTYLAERHSLKPAANKSGYWTLSFSWILLGLVAVFSALALWQASDFGKHIDLAFSKAVWSYRTSGMNYWMQLVTIFGENDVLAGITAAICAALFAHGLLIGQFKWAKDKILLLSLTMLATMGVMHLLKFVFARPRPPHDFLLSEPLKSFSFPSGHASMTMTLCGVLILLLVRAELPRSLVRAAIFSLIALTLLVGFSRIYLAYHYLSDVLAGFTLGLIAMLVAAKISNRLQQVASAEVDRSTF